MNRLELGKEIIDEGRKRGIVVTKCRIFDRYSYLDFYPEIENNFASTWVYEHQVEQLIDDLALLERPHKIADVRLDGSRYNLFHVGDSIEVDNVWIRLDDGEKEDKDLIKENAGCGQYRQGWVKGEVFETPAQNDRALGIKFSRDVYIEGENVGWISCVEELEKLIRIGSVKKIEAGQPIWAGTNVWSIRKP